MTWKPINTAPTSGGDNVPPFHYGPWIFVRGGQEDARVRWRSALARGDITTGENHEVVAQWVDRDDRPLTFEPTLWMEIE